MKGELNILHIMLEAGIVVKLVLLALVAGSIVSWAIILMKKKSLNSMKQNNKNFFDVYQKGGSLKEMMTKSAEMPFSPYKLMFEEGYGELSRIKAEVKDAEPIKGLKDHFQRMGLECLERAMKKGVHSANGEMERSLATLASIGSISPFVGLFGTVWGIINSFTGLAQGGATLDAVAPGIAEALVATAVGLAAAIPAVWFYNRFNAEVGQINAEMESFGQDFLNSVERTLV
jgi:biopolymer transport protein TolQ